MKANQAARNDAGDDNGAASVGAIISVLLVAVVGLALVKTIQSSTNTSRDAVGSTSAAGGLVVLVPLFFVIIIVAMMVSYIYFKAD